MASYSEKFDAAVSVIKNLPKNGPFQPSYDMMKRFYGLYKQATEGQCRQAKPAFWNVVQTHKWQAWSSLGAMSSEEAKELYVEELLKVILNNSNAQDIPHMYQIIETMPQTEDVVTFLKVMGPFFEMVMDSAEDRVATSVTKAVKVNGLMNGGVKMIENGVDERGDYPKAISSGAHQGVNGMQNGHVENGALVDGESKDDESTEDGKGTSNDEDDGLKDGEARDGQMEPAGEDGREQKDYVMVRSSHQGDDSLELSHPILISKSQLESADGTVGGGAEGEEHPSQSSESESDGDEFCDSMDEPLMNGGTVDQTPHMDSLPTIDENGAETHLTSTPFNLANAVVTEAQVHNHVDAVVTTPHYSTSFSSAPPRTTPSRRGGGDVADGAKGHQGQGRTRQGASGGGGLHRDSSRQTSAFRDHGATPLGVGADGGGGGGRTPGGNGSPLGSPIPDDVVEQITLSLERLQRDMNSVLVRLNTLETIAVSRHQIETQQAYMREGVIPPGPGSLPVGTPSRPSSSSWWPFSTLPVKTVFFLLVWPFVVQWLLRFLRHRRARPRPR